MAGRVITVTSGKGGVGKTTFSANVSAALAALGKKTVAVDTDVGLRNLDIVMGLENRIVFDLVDVVEGRCRLQKRLSAISASTLCTSSGSSDSRQNCGES